MNTILETLRKVLIPDSGGELTLCASQFSNAGGASATHVPELCDFLDKAFSSSPITFRAIPDGGPLISRPGAAELTITGSTKVFDTISLPRAVLLLKEADGLLEIRFDGSWGRDDVFRLPLLSELPLLSAVAMKDVHLLITSVGISTDLPRDVRFISSELHGTFDFGLPGGDRRITLKKSNGDNWRLDVAELDEAIEDRQDSIVAELTRNSSLARFLPEPLVWLIAGVKEISAEFSPASVAVSWFALNLAFATKGKRHESPITLKGKGHEWPITSGLAIRDLGCTVVLINPVRPASAKQHEYPRSIEGTVTGTVKIGGTTVQVTVQGSSSQESVWTFRVKPPAGESIIRLPSVADLLRLAGGEDLLAGWPDGFKDIPAIGIYRLEIDFNPWQKTVDLMSFHIGTAEPWTLIKDFCVLEDLNIAFGIQNVTFAPERRIEGGLQATARIGAVKFFVSVSLDHGPDSGWQLVGRVEDHKPSSLQEVADRLLHMSFAEKPLTLPQAIATFHVTDVAISFNTSSKDFSFTCDGDLTVETRKIAGRVTLELKHRLDGDFSIHFSGEITVDGLQFALVFDNTTESTQALAIYDNLEGKSQQIRNLIQPVSPELARLVPESLEFTLKNAMLGYTAAQGKPSKFLFGVDIEGGLNLSDVKLPDFPMISQFAPPPDQTLKIAVQVVGANAPFNVEEVAALNALNPSGLRLPIKEINGLAVGASLRLGQEVKQFSLPIGVKTQSDSGSFDQKGTNAIVDQSDPSAVAASTSSTAQAVSDDGTQWMMIQKTYPPVHFERVGIAYKDNRIKGELDAALSVGGLTISLDGLSVTSPLTKFDPEFSLRGLGIDYRNGPLEIGGAFLKQTRKEGDATYASFAGLAVLRTKALTLSAIGSYALKDGHPSLFIYAVLDYPLGGPAFFFVTGLAAGFGYNRALTIPTIEQVESFPLVQQAMGAPESSTARALPADQKEQQNLLTERLESLEGYIPRAVGEHFLAIGVSFTSFKTVNSFALLTLKFGAEFEIDVLGLSTLNVPNVAFAQLALKATFKPQAGFLGVRAQLTPNSYLLSQRCHLTGGFAFLCWFQGDKNLKIANGDFVLTLGGYHPLYEPPAHYPRVPRLGFDWQVDDYLHLKGDAYYAMVPHALMAGCHLEATWHKDQLKAWFTAGADFLICWQPYHYDAKIYVDLGASYTFDLFGSHTVTVDLGADLHLWGPEFAGEAHIHWWIISFTVNFGKTTPQGIKSIQWKDFKTAFLPARSQVCGIALQQGLIRQIQQDGKDYWIVNPKDFVLVTNSVIPSTSSKTESQEDSASFAAAVRPMGAEAITSTHTITIQNLKSRVDYTKRFRFTSVKKSVPAAMWGIPEFTGDDKKFLKPPNVNEKTSLIENTLAGFEIRPIDANPGKGAQFVPQQYDTEPIPDAWKWEPWILTESNFNQRGTAAWKTAANNNDRIESSTRNRLLQALGFANIAN